MTKKQKEIALPSANGKAKHEKIFLLSYHIHKHMASRTFSVMAAMALCVYAGAILMLAMIFGGLAAKVVASLLATVLIWYAFVIAI